MRFSGRLSSSQRLLLTIGVALRLQLPGLPRTRLIERPTEMGHDVGAVEHMHSLVCFLGDRLQARFPPVRADIVQALAALLAQPAKKPQQGLHAALVLAIDLIDQRQVFVSRLPRQLVDPNRLNDAPILVGASPFDRHLHRAKYCIPGGANHLGANSQER